MLELEDAPSDPDTVVYEVMSDAQMSEPEIAISAGVPIAQTRLSLSRLEADGRVWKQDDQGLIVWSRT